MPVLAQPKASFNKMILLGDSGSGKTGALISLIAKGYKVHVLDFDAKLQNGILPRLVAKHCPDKFSNIDFIALRDNYSGLGTNFAMFKGLPSAFSDGMKALDKWQNGSNPSEWGDGHVLVLDSLVFAGDAAQNWAYSMNPGSKDPRQWYYSAQDAVETMLAKLTSDHFKAHVIVNAHVGIQTRPDGAMKGFPVAVGKALGPTIPGYFDTMALVERRGVGKDEKRFIRTISTTLLDLKNPASIDPAMLSEYPIETGLAQFFETLKK